MATSTPKDPTFQSYSANQAKAYAASREGYDSALYNLVYDHHAATGGQFGLVLDCGCGPGNATRDLALKFDQALGTDAGAAMITAAREIGGKTKSGADIRFEVAPAETFSQVEGLKPGSVDLLTVAMAVHWFDMDKFYAEAAKVLKPGGTLALWTKASGYPHPDEHNAQKLKETMLHFEREVLGKYELPGNRLSRDMYDKLPLPWDVSPPVSEFSKSNFVKHDFDRDGILTNGKTFFSGGKSWKVGDLEKVLGTASMVTRWREANPDLVGTEQDCVRQYIAELQAALGGKDECFGGSATAILLFKKST